ALVAAILSTPHPGESELRVTLRVTALVSATFFLAAFTASAWRRLRPTPTTRWLLRNRRYLGLSFAAPPLVHGLAILALARRLPAAFPAALALRPAARSGARRSVAPSAPPEPPMRGAQSRDHGAG